MNELHYKYKCDGFIEKFSNGRTQFTNEEQQYIDGRFKQLRKTYDAMDVFELDSINACMIMESDFINDFCHKLMDEEGFQLVICKNPRTASCSLRSNHPTLNLGAILKRLGFGGGHKNAAGIIESDPFKLQEKLRTFELDVYKDFKDMRIN